MGISNAIQTGQSGMIATKAQIETAGHNITNSTKDGYSRQRVEQKSQLPGEGPGKNLVGRGTVIGRVGRINDDYLDKQIRKAGMNFSELEEKGMLLSQVEGVLNEMDGEGLNRLVSKFFNDFRKLANDPNSDAVRQSVRESSVAMVNDFKRLRSEMVETQKHIDSRIEGTVRELNSLGQQVAELNVKIKTQMTDGSSPNDLLDEREQLVKKINSYINISTHDDGKGSLNIDIKGLGPFVNGARAEKFETFRSSSDERGKGENVLDISTTASASPVITHRLKGGKLGGLLDVRDGTVSKLISKLDDLAFNISQSVNQIHSQGVTRQGAQGVSFFKSIVGKEGAAERLDLSEAVRANVNNIATALELDSPGDNRVALAISGLQSRNLMGDGTVTFDGFYNSIISDVGVTLGGVKAKMNQSKDVVTQLEKMREKISGVSIDEETANLLQFQHVFDASAKVIQVAEKMLDTVLALGR